MCGALSVSKRRRLNEKFWFENWTFLGLLNCWIESLNLRLSRVRWKFRENSNVDSDLLWRSSRVDTLDNRPSQRSEHFKALIPSRQASTGRLSPAAAYCHGEYKIKLHTKFVYLNFAWKLNSKFSARKLFGASKANRETENGFSMKDLASRPLIKVGEFAFQALPAETWVVAGKWISLKDALLSRIY